LDESIDREIDLLIESLEEMIDARDDMWQEEKFCNYRQMIKIREDRYEPAKDKLKFFLTEIIKTIALKR
jgi:hypothetical protein